MTDGPGTLHPIMVTDLIVWDRILGGRKTSKEHFVRERECSGTARPYNQTVEKVRYPAIE